MTYNRPKGNYFSLPNEVYMLGLKPRELAVYSYLLRCENRETYQCHPSYKTIGNATGMGTTTVQKAVRGLEDKCLIYTEPTTVTTKDGKTRNGSLLYTIRPFREALDYYYETATQTHL